MGVSESTRYFSKGELEVLYRVSKYLDLLVELERVVLVIQDDPFERKLGACL